MPQSRDQYEVIESFTDQVGLGKEYAKVRYKGIDQVGYISRVDGPGDEISKEWYQEKKRQQPDAEMKRIIGVVKGKYRSGGLRSIKDFDFKITVEGKAPLPRDSAEELMEDTLEECLSFARANIEAMQKATVTQDPTDEEAIDIQPQEGRSKPHKGKHEMIFRNGAWYGYGFPRKLIKFPASVSMSRSLSKSEKTIQDL
jgi:hypothetical protein